MANGRSSDTYVVSDPRSLETDAVAAAEKARQRLEDARKGLATLQQMLTRISEVTASLKPLADRLSDMTLSGAGEVVRAGAPGRAFLSLIMQLGEIACQSATALRQLENCVRQSVASLQHAINQAEHANWQVEQIMPALQTLNAAERLPMPTPTPTPIPTDTEASETDRWLAGIWPSTSRGPTGAKN
jgi:hypothetical protein